MELDINGDGRIRDDEFSIYQIQKQAGEEFIPQGSHMSKKIQQTMFEALLIRGD